MRMGGKRLIFVFSFASITYLNEVVERMELKEFVISPIVTRFYSEEFSSSKH